MIVIGLSLRSLLLYRPIKTSEGFSIPTKVQRVGDTAHMSGYVNIENGNVENVYKPESGPHPSQIGNVPTAKEYLIGRINRFKSHVPLKHSDKDYVIGQMDDEILQKFSLGDVPNIILNPDSAKEEQITCDIEEDCDEYVRNSNLYCPIGMDRLKIKESSGKINEQKYQGCYTATNKYPEIACRFGSRFNYCDYINELRIQKVGRGFYVIPTYDALSQIKRDYGTDNKQMMASLRHIDTLKINLIRNMILSFDHPEIKNNKDRITKWSPGSSTGSSLVDQYARQVYYNTFVLFQNGNHKTQARIGFIMRKDTPSGEAVSVSHIPELSTPTTRHSYNLKHVKYVHDTMRDPMPVLKPNVYTSQTKLNRRNIT